MVGHPHRASSALARSLPPVAAMAALIATLAAASGCGAAGTAPEEPGRSTAIAKLDGSRWVWVDSECSDGAVRLGAVGLERELSFAVDQASLLMTFETRLATEGCSTTEVWSAGVSPTGQFRFEPQAHVTLPAGAECGAVAREAVDGTMRLSGEVLEVLTTRSPWCRGFDARFVYRRAPARQPDAHALVTRYVAHFNRRDARSMAELFAEAGSLVEPFTRTDDGNYQRHQGRSAIEAWYASAFASAPWLAMRLLAIDATGGGGQVAAAWEYMDGNLQAPIRGRNLFVVAGGEIFETELQLETAPRPRGGDPDRQPVPVPPVSARAIGADGAHDGG